MKNKAGDILWLNRLWLCGGYDSLSHKKNPRNKFEDLSLPSVTYCDYNSGQGFNNLNNKHANSFPFMGSISFHNDRNLSGFLRALCLVVFRKSGVGSQLINGLAATKSFIASKIQNNNILWLNRLWLCVGYDLSSIAFKISIKIEAIIGINNFIHS